MTREELVAKFDNLFAEIETAQTSTQESAAVDEWATETLIAWKEWMRAALRSPTEGFVTVPKVPSRRTLWLLGKYAMSAAYFGEDDHAAGKLAQQTLGLEAIPPNYEYEIGYGTWLRLLEILKSAAPSGPEGEG